MGNKFYDVMLRRSDLLHSLAIWQEIVDHLSKFLDTDAAPASVGIRTEGGGMVVPQDRVEAVLDEIKHGRMTEINRELESIHKSEVAEDAKQKRQVSKKKGKVKSKAKGKKS